jgi:integrase
LDIILLIEAAKANRHGHWDATMILLAFRHGLRAAELCDLRWDQVDSRDAKGHGTRKRGSVVKVGLEYQPRPAYC